MDHLFLLLSWCRKILLDNCSYSVSFRNFRYALLVVGCICCTGCGPGRPAVPPGEIPRAPTVTPEDEDYGQTVLGQLTQKNPLDRNDAYINRTRDIVERLAKAAHAERAPWHVYVLNGDSIANAAATRGNYVFVWTGMLKKASSDGELATVLAHELGHVLAGHTMATPEEEAAQIMAEVSGQIVSGVLSQTQYGIFADLAGMLIESAIAAMVVNPASQANEIEADHIGFFLMSDAGYDPHEAISLWTKMAQDPSASDSLSFLSSHPTSATRLEDLQALLPQALERYQRSKSNGKTAPSISAPLPSTPASSNKSKGKKKSEQDTGAVKKEKTKDGSLGEMPEKRPDALLIVATTTSVRTDPNIDAPEVAKLQKGTQVTVQFSLGEWHKISAPVSGYVPHAALAAGR